MLNFQFPDSLIPVAIASTYLLLPAMSEPSLAASTHYDIKVQDLSGPLAGQEFIGSVDVDVPSFVGSGYYCWSHADCGDFDRLVDIDLSFNFLGTEFTEDNFNTSGSSPGVVLDESGKLTQLFWRADFTSSVTPIADGFNFFIFTSKPYVDWFGNSIAGYRFEYLLDYVDGFPVGVSGRGQIATSSLGSTQLSPLLPTTIFPGEFWFEDVFSGLWYDPPATDGFHYEMINDSLFTEIMNFPSNLDPDNLFTVSVGETVLGEFGPGSQVNFVDLLGEGVPHFTITGIDADLDISDPTAFPLQIAFNTEKASFKMRAIASNPPPALPEPGTTIAMLVIALTGGRLLKGTLRQI